MDVFKENAKDIFSILNCVIESYELVTIHRDNFTCYCKIKKEKDVLNRNLCVLTIYVTIKIEDSNGNALKNEKGKDIEKQIELCKLEKYTYEYKSMKKIIDELFTPYQWCKDLFNKQHVAGDTKKGKTCCLCGCKTSILKCNNCKFYYCNNCIHNKNCLIIPDNKECFYKKIPIVLVYLLRNIESRPINEYCDLYEIDKVELEKLAKSFSDYEKFRKHIEKLNLRQINYYIYHFLLKVSKERFKNDEQNKKFINLQDYLSFFSSLTDEMKIIVSILFIHYENMECRLKNLQAENLISKDKFKRMIKEIILYQDSNFPFKTLPFYKAVMKENFE